MSGENVDKFLQEFEVDQTTRTTLNTNKPDVIIGENNGKWSLTYQSLSGASTMEFTPGVEFEHESPIEEEDTTV